MATYEARMRRWPVPYEPMDITGRYGRTHLVASGPEDAPPLVLLHGAMASLTMWAANIADLSRDYRVYAVDIIGEPSKSIPTQPQKTREDCVAWLSEVLDALDIESTHMVGMSYGGWLTLNYAIGAPQRLKKIALLSPPGSFVPLAKQFLVCMLLMMYLRRRFLVESFLRWVTHEDALRDPIIRAIAFDELIDQMYLGLRYFRMPGEAPPIVFSDEELRGLQVPTLLLIGAQEVIYDPQAALERARRLIPDFEGELVPRASHEMIISKHEIADRRVLEFLRERSVHPQSIGANG